MILSRNLYILLLLVISPVIHGRPIIGTVHSGEIKLAEVVITDGFNFTKTDQLGNFLIEVSDKSDFIYIITPSGYTANKADGITQFYKRIELETKSVDFDLIPYNNSSKYVVIAVGDPQTKTIEHYNTFESTILPDIKQTAKMYANMGIPVIALYLGDIVWDTMSLFENHKKGINQLGIPVFTVIGNHDYQKELVGDKECSITYCKHFGPTYYGFDFGNTHFIILDNIIYDTNKKYIEDLDQQQIDWLKKYLEYIPKRSNIIISLHAPIGKFWIKNYAFTHGHKQLIDLLEGYNLRFITGHLHVNSNIEILPNVIEHNVASSCGAWWNNYYAPDGTPSGYQVFELSNTKTEWYYKSINKDRDFQMELYKKGSFSQKPDAIVVKIWNWDPLWKVEYYEDGELKGNMNQFDTTDPSYTKAMEKRIIDGKITRSSFERSNYLMPRTSYFYFYAAPAIITKRIDVVATDRFGKRYSNTINL